MRAWKAMRCRETIWRVRTMESYRDRAPAVRGRTGRRAVPRPARAASIPRAFREHSGSICERPASVRRAPALLARGRDPPCEVVQVRRDAMQLAGRRLQSGERDGLFLRRRRHRLGAGPIAVRDPGDPRDPLLEPGALLLLVT